MSEVLRLLLVDDHELFRDGMASRLSYEPDILVVGQAANGREALAKVRETQPDLVLMDIDMAEMNGLEATRRLVAEHPDLKIVMLTVHEEDDKLFEAIKSGAQGYLLKNIRTSEMLDMLRGVAQGEAAISRLMASKLLAEFARRGSGDGYQVSGVGDSESDNSKLKTSTTPGGVQNSKLEDLTQRELEVLELVAKHASNKEIAATLSISEYTVKNHLRNILAKLHLRNRSQAAQVLLKQQS